MNFDAENDKKQLIRDNIICDYCGYMLPNHEHRCVKKEQQPIKSNDAPIWYTKDAMKDYLLNNNYSKEIVEELSQMFADNLQSSFKKGWEKGYNDFNPDKSTFNYKYFEQKGNDVGDVEKAALYLFPSQLQEMYDETNNESLIVDISEFARESFIKGAEWQSNQQPTNPITIKNFITMVKNSSPEIKKLVMDELGVEQKEPVDKINDGYKLLRDLLNKKNEVNEDSMPVAIDIDKPKGGTTCYLRHDAVVKYLNK